MEKCIECSSTERVKNGFHHGVQRYKCKACGYQYTGSNIDRQERNDITKSLAITLYLAGVPYKKVASLVKFSHYYQDVILDWVRARNFKIRETDPEITKEEWHEGRLTYVKYIAQEKLRIKRNRSETDILKKIYGVNNDFKLGLEEIIKYMSREESKSVKRFVVIEVHRYSGEVKKVMLTP